MVPEIRFEEFDSEWEETTIGDKVNVSSASRVHKDEWSDYGVPFFRSSDVISAFNNTDNEKAYIPFTLYEQLSSLSGKVKKGDVLVTGGGSIGIPYLVEDNKPLYFKDADLVWIKNSGIIDGKFLYSFYTSILFRKYLTSISHVTTISHYTIEQTKGTPINLPELEEQRTIGSYFEKIDKLINKKEIELDKTKQFKQAMLQKMFPKEGETVPEIRFDGFEGEWEVFQMGDIALIGTGYTPPRKDASNFNGDIMWVSVADMSNKYIYESKEKLSKKAIRGEKWVEAETLIMSFKLTVGRLAITKTKCMTNEAIANFEWVRPGINNEYMYSYLSSVDISKYGNAATQGISLNAESLRRIRVLLPSNEEQIKLGKHFKKLDQNIQSKQAELKKLKQFKQAMLDKMFV